MCAHCIVRSRLQPDCSHYKSEINTLGSQTRKGRDAHRGKMYHSIAQKHKEEDWLVWTHTWQRRGEQYGLTILHRELMQESKATSQIADTYYFHQNNCLNP